jgi:hypothetical protein
MYAMYMRYTIAEFKKHTRKILNEALEGPVTITRYDDEFVLTAASNLKSQMIVAKLENLGTDKPVFEPVKELIKKRSKPDYCKEHDIEKEFCKTMKHRGV